MDWNARYQEQDTPWDKGIPTPVLAEIHERHPGIFSGSTIVVPGCGTGHDVRWLAEQGAEATGLDIAPLAIAKARDLDPTGQADYQVADFLDPDSPLPDTFDQLWEHTCFCALDPSLRAAYLKAARRYLKPGGTLVGVFFINPEMDEGETGPPFGIDEDELSRTLEEAGFRTTGTWVPTTGFPGRIGRERVMILSRD
ncbi:methyltransferase domain-containing protein [Luteolibacter sp. SL250]|uniref:methyltransferase domain-containing protein n=1 Tax=Luteolibacter sp. SL250 TaxID=2995170 RepID=UPI002271D4B2|nr:methyltransferase domain-containing protein [Luteolibacter sp. SL250]WAC20640.1 methyltransferase domain-containing protein [Luteolibacter sp. SL250]